MKFGKRLQDEIVPQWAELYVNYKRLKQFIRNSELRSNEFANELFKIIKEELSKPEALFQDLVNELQHGHDELLEMSADIPVPAPKHNKKFHRRCRRCLNEDVSNEKISRISMAESSFADSYSDMDTLSHGSCFTSLKHFFLFIIGDFQVAHREVNAPRAHFLEWHSNATQLQHFADLNVEAIRKASKKLKKYRSNEADFSIAIEAELARSRLTALMPRLHNLLSSVSSDYERKFKEPLDHYANVSLSQKWYAKWAYVLLAFALFYIVMYAPIFNDHRPAHNCLALFVFVIVLWIFEAIPFFCTAMLIPIFAVHLGIVSDPDTLGPASATVASHIILGKLFNHVQILVMGGLTIGKAFGRINLEMYVASALHRLTGHRPALYLLGIMVVSCALCAFVSNIAAPLLVLSVIQRTLWEFPEGTKAPHAILLGLAFACNIGGMLSPIASPQNAVAITVLRSDGVSFSEWVAVALPVVVVCLLVSWLVVLFVWKPFEDVAYIPLQVVDIETDKQVSAASRVIVITVSAITVVLWILPASLFFGDSGIVALIPIVVFFGTGILSNDDFNNLSWHLMFLLAGGNMLGLCAHDSKLLTLIVDSMRGLLQTSPAYLTVILVISMVGVVTTFVSHTVSAMILLPIILKIALLMPHTDGTFAITPQSFVMLCALMCSGAMAFPISSFPNVNSLLVEDQKGVPYLRAKDFLLCGTIISLIFTLCLCTWMVPVANYVLESKV